MAPLSIIGALSALPLAFAHMQMSSPSPLRDPHANRVNEPKDYNILNPLNADGSNFACKGYHLNTPLTTVATYAAGSTQTLTLRGSATHGGGSCQISLSCDGGNSFNVMKSIIGGCPLSDSYDFTIPKELPAAKKCLLAWTWFNRIGNREMYMNCAVVDITNKRQSKRDTQVSAASALSRYPELFVANLANINSCRIQETTDVIFDNPGKSVDYGNGDNASMKPSFKRGECTGKPSKNAGSKDTSSSNSGGGDSGQWSAPAESPSSSSSSDSDSCAAKIQSGQWHPECSGGNSNSNQQEQKPTQQLTQQRPEQSQQSKQSQQSQSKQQKAPKKSDGKKPNTRVQQELDAYLATLYGRGVARRDEVPANAYDDAKEYPTAPHKHVHGKNCKHKAGYSPDSHYDNENEDSYPDDAADYSYKRVARERRWTTYSKRQDVPVPARVPKKYFRGPASEYAQQAPNPATDGSSNKAVPVAPSKPVSADATSQAPQNSSKQATSPASNQAPSVDLKQASTETTAQSSSPAAAQNSTEATAVKVWNDMSESEKFDAFLRRMVELSNNMYSLVKYAAASTVNLPWYPPASTYDRTSTSTDATTSTDTSAQQAPAVYRLARRGLASRAPAQVYPGPSVGSISAPGDATDAEDGFRAWFPDLVQGPVTKRQLVDPVTSEASAEAGDSVTDDSVTDNSANFFDALAASFWKLVGNSFSYYNNDDTDSDSDGDLDASDIPILLGEPVNTDIAFPDFSIPDLDDATIIVTVGPLPTDADAQGLPGHGSFWHHDDSDADGAWEGEDGDDEAEDASHRRPRPGWSQPLIPYPVPENSTAPSSSNSTDADAAKGPVADDVPEYMPYANKTLGELVSDILDDPSVLDFPLGFEESSDDASLTPVPSDSSDDVPAANPLQEAADQAEEGATVPQEPVEFDPTKVDSVADAFPWLLAPGPVVSESVPAVNEDGGDGERM